MELWLVRHAETTHNAAGIWQGQGNAPLSDRGRDQAQRLGRRLSGVQFDRVVSSDLDRAADTARATGAQVETDPLWREIDVGDWEGRTNDELLETQPEQVGALRRGELHVRVGGGESWNDLFERIDEAFARLRARLSSTDRVLVVSHGGALHALMAGVLGLRDRYPRPIGRLSNTALTVLRLDSRGELRVTRYNDAVHVDPLGQWARQKWQAGSPLVSLVGCDPVDDRRRAARSGDRGPQPAPLPAAEQLASWYDGLDHLYTTHGHAASEMAAVLAERFAVGPPQPPGSAAELPEAARRVSSLHPGARVGLVTEGGAIGRYADAEASGEGLERWSPPGTGVSHVVITERGSTFADYNVGAPLVAGP